MAIPVTLPPGAYLYDEYAGVVVGGMVYYALPRLADLWRKSRCDCRRKARAGHWPLAVRVNGRWYLPANSRWVDHRRYNGG